MRSIRQSWKIRERLATGLEFDMDVELSATSCIPLRSRRRRRGLAFGISALAAAAAAAIVGIGASEIDERRAFDSTSRPLALETLGSVAPTNPDRGGSDGMTVSVAMTSAPSPPSDSHAAERSLRTGAIGIAMVGDSWISGSKLDVPLQEALANVGLPDVRVKGIGQGGATSRVILQNLVSEDPSNAFSSRSVIEAGDYEYCLVIAGVNDSATHLGADFYAHHMTEIVSLLVARGVTPLILELPEYGIEAVRAERRGLSLFKDWALSALFDQGEVDVVGKYRSAMIRSLEGAGLMEQIEFIRFDPVVADYHESVDLYKDPVHLNAQGNERLTAHLASFVLNMLERRDRLDRSDQSVRLAGR